MESEDITQQKLLLQTYRRTLAVYIQQQAAIGRAFSSPAIVNGIAETRREIQRIKALLRSANVDVEDGPDDDDTNVPVVLVQAANQRWLWIGSISIVLLAVVVGIVFLRFLRQPQLGALTPLQTAIPPIAAATNTAVAQATAHTLPEHMQITAMPLAGSTRNALLVFQDDFSSGKLDTWSGNSDTWSIVQVDDVAAYQGAAHNGEETSGAPLRLPELPNDYAVEVQVRIVRVGVANAPDFTLTLRANTPTVQGCHGYGFAYYGSQQAAYIARFGEAACPFQLLASAQAALEPQQWYRLRAEVIGSKQRLLLNDQVIAEAEDASIKGGTLYLSVGNDATVQFTKIRVFTFK